MRSTLCKTSISRNTTTWKTFVRAIRSHSRPPASTPVRCILEFIASMDSEQAYRRAQALKISWSRVFQPQDTLAEEQFTYRDFFHHTAWPGHTDTYLTASLPWKLRENGHGDTVPDVVRPPALGEHTDAVLAEWTSRSVSS